MPKKDKAMKYFEKKKILSLNHLHKKKIQNAPA